MTTKVMGVVRCMCLHERVERGTKKRKYIHWIRLQRRISDALSLYMPTQL